MAFVKDYVDFRYKHPEKLGLKNKGKLTRVFNELNEVLTNNPVAIKPRSLTKAKEAFNNGYFTPATNKHITAVFLPPHTPKGSRIKLSSAGIPELVSNAHIEREVDFDKEAFADDPEKEINRALNSVKGFDRFFLNQGGQISTEQLNTPGKVLDAIRKLIDQYSGMKPKSGEGENHNYQNWLFGIRAVKLTGQETPNSKGSKSRGKQSNGKAGKNKVSSNKANLHKIHRNRRG